MLRHNLSFASFLALTFFATVTVAFCAESNQVEQAQSAKAPQILEKDTSSKIFRPYLPSNPFSDSTKFQARPAAPAPPQSSATPSMRDDEKLDRQKNWIFAKPEVREKGESVDEVFGVGRVFENQKSRGVVNEFLNGPDTSAPKTSQEKELNSFSLQPYTGLGNPPSGRNGGPQGSLMDPSREKQVTGFSAEQTRLSEMWREQFGANGERRREEHQANMKEFENLFRPPNPVPSEGNGLNVFGQNAQPAAVARSGPDRFNPGAAAASSSDNFRTTPRFAPGASGLERPDINTRVFGATASPPPVENRNVERPPIVLPVPKRKF